jgi:hypothetical protein
VFSFSHPDRPRIFGGSDREYSPLSPEVEGQLTQFIPSFSPLQMSHHTLFFRKNALELQKFISAELCLMQDSA